MNAFSVKKEYTVRPLDPKTPIHNNLESVGEERQSIISTHIMELNRMLPKGYGFVFKEASGDENCVLFSVERPVPLPAPLLPQKKSLEGALFVFQPGPTKGRQIWDMVQLAQGMEEVVGVIDKLEMHEGQKQGRDDEGIEADGEGEFLHVQDLS